MGRISVDNGATWITAEEALESVKLDDMVNYMDDEFREEVHNELAPCTDLEFLKRYLEICNQDFIIG